MGRAPPWGFGRRLALTEELVLADPEWGFVLGQGRAFRGITWSSSQPGGFRPREGVAGGLLPTGLCPAGTFVGMSQGLPGEGPIPPASSSQLRASARAFNYPISLTTICQASAPMEGPSKHRTPQVGARSPVFRGSGLSPCWLRSLGVLPSKRLRGTYSLEGPLLLPPPLDLGPIHQVTSLFPEGVKLRRAWGGLGVHWGPRPGRGAPGGSQGLSRRGQASPCPRALTPA